MIDENDYLFWCAVAFSAGLFIGLWLGTGMKGW